jgi:hypothetical protein
MVSGGRSENDQLHPHDGIDHIYEEEIDISTLSAELPNRAGHGQSAEVNAQNGTLAIPDTIEVVDISESFPELHQRGSELQRRAEITLKYIWWNSSSRRSSGI